MIPTSAHAGLFLLLLAPAALAQRPERSAPHAEDTTTATAVARTTAPDESSGGGGGFVERALELGLDHRSLTGLDTFDNPSVTGKIARDWANIGLAAADMDGDGDLDVFANGALLPNTLFRNDGGSFTDVTSSSGALNVRDFDRCSAFADYDGDGDADLFVGVFEGSGAGPLPGQSRLYRNDGSGSFEEVTPLAGTFGNGRTLHGYWYDLDLDGRLDLYTSEFNLTPNRWYRNNGDGTFTELSAARGIDSAGSTHVTSAVDTDQDGWVDLIVANDYLVGAAMEYENAINPGDRYLHGQPDGSFDDISGPVMMAHAKGVMGLTFGDVDYDGDLDVYKSNIQNNLLAINNGAPGSGVPWQQQQLDYGIANDQIPFPGNLTETGASVGWGVHFFNANFDRWDDLFVVNGHVAAGNFHTANLPKPQLDYLFIGQGPGADFAFADETAAYGLYYFNDERGSVVGDFDLDGDTDIMVASTSGRLRYHENQVARNGQGSIQVVAETGTSAPHGIGTVVRWIDSEGYPHTRVIGSDSPTAAQTPYEVEFGLGIEPNADVVVRFPSGIVQTYDDVPTNTRLVATEPELFRLSTPTMSIQGSGVGASTCTISAFAHAVDGTPLDETASVTISIPGLSATGPVVHVQGNEFERTFETSNTSRSYRAVLEFNGFRPAVAPVVHVHAGPDPLTSIVRAIPEAVRAGSSDSFVLWVTPKDTNGISAGTNLEVDVEPVPALTLLDEVVHGDGRYSFEYAAPASPATIGFTITANGLPIQAPTVDAGGAADGTQTTYHFEQGHPPQAATPEQVKILVQPRDAAGRRLGPNADVTLRLATVDDGKPSPGPGPGGGASNTDPTHAGGSVSVGLGAPTLWVHEGFGAPGQRDGDFVFVLEKTAGYPDYLPAGFVEILYEGAPIAAHAYTYFPQQF